MISVSSSEAGTSEVLPASITLTEVFGRLEKHRLDLKRVDEELEELLTERQRLQQRVAQSSTLKEELASVVDGVRRAESQTLSRQLELDSILEGVRSMDSTHTRVSQLMKRVSLMLGLKDTIRQTETSIEQKDYDNACAALQSILKEAGEDMKEADPVSFQILMDVRQRLEEELVSECTDARTKKDYSLAKHFAKLLPKITVDASLIEASITLTDDSSSTTAPLLRPVSALECGLQFYTGCVTDCLMQFATSEGLLLESMKKTTSTSLPHVGMLQGYIDAVFHALNENSDVIGAEFGTGHELMLVSALHLQTDARMTALIRDYRQRANVNAILQFSDKLHTAVARTGSGLMALFKPGAVGSGVGIGTVVGVADSGRVVGGSGHEIEQLITEQMPMRLEELIPSVVELAVICRELESYDVTMRNFVSDCVEALSKKQMSAGKGKGKKKTLEISEDVKIDGKAHISSTDASDLSVSLSKSESDSGWKSWRMPDETGLNRVRHTLISDYIQMEMLALQLQCIRILKDEMTEVVACARQSLESDASMSEALSSGTAANRRELLASRKSQTGADLLSPATQTLFYVLKQTAQRAMSTYDVNATCAVVNNISTLIESLLKEWLDAALRSLHGQRDKSFAAHLWHESSATASYVSSLTKATTAAAAFASAAATGSSPQLQERIAAVVLNDCDECMSNLVLLRQDLERQMEEEFGDTTALSEKERFKIRDGLRVMVETKKSFERVVERGLSRLVQSREAVIGEALHRLHAFSYLLTESQFVSGDFGESFVHSMQPVLDPLLSELRRLLSAQNFERVLTHILATVNSRVESELLSKRLTFWGAMQFDSDRQQLETWFGQASASGASVRDQFARLRLVTRLLQCSKVAEFEAVVSDVYGDDAFGRRDAAASVSLSVADMLQFLSLRTEFTAEQISQLRTKFVKWI